MDCITVEDRHQGSCSRVGPPSAASELQALDSLVFNVHSHCLFGGTGQGDARLGAGSVGREQVRTWGGWDSLSPRRKGQWWFDTLCGSFGKVFHSLPQHSKLLKPCHAPGVDLRVKNPLPLPLVYIRNIRRAHVSALEKLVETGRWSCELHAA